MDTTKWETRTLSFRWSADEVDISKWFGGQRNQWSWMLCPVLFTTCREEGIHKAGYFLLECRIEMTYENEILQHLIVLIQKSVQ